jgi:hypothetical protein
MIRTQNGARRKILASLAREGILTTDELAALTDLTAKQVRDNCAAARHEGLLTNELDDVTNHLAYKITPEGRQRIDYTGVADEPTESPSEPPPITVDSANPAEISTDDLVVDELVVDTRTFSARDPEDEPPAEEPADEPHSDARYALCRAGDDHMSAWPLRLMSLDAAKQIAVDDASTINGEVVLYRCTPVGRAVPRFVFEEA